MNASETQSRQRQKSEPHTVVESAQQTCESFEKCVEENPLSAVMISAVVGIGIGVVIGRSLGARHEPEPLGWFDSRTAEKMGHQFLAAMSRMVPESISNRFS